MMKKMMAGLLASCMLLSAAPAYAAETEAAAPVEVNWSDVTDALEAAGQDPLEMGDFYTFNDIACMMWAPHGLEPQELTEEDTENGMIAYFSTEEGDAAASVVYVDLGGEDLAYYKGLLAEDEDVSDLSDIVINGINGIGYDLKDKDSRSVAFETDSGYVLEFTFAPVSDENFESVLTMMMASIQPEQEAETEA